MPSILTDQRIKDDCFDTRFPINALSVLKVKTFVNKDNVVIQAPEVLPIAYPSSINSLSKGLAATLDMPQQKIKLFLEKEVRAEIQEEKVEMSEDVEMEEEEERMMEQYNKRLVVKRNPRSDKGVKRGRNKVGQAKDEAGERESMMGEDVDAGDTSDLEKMKAPDVAEDKYPIDNLRGSEL